MRRVTSFPLKEIKRETRRHPALLTSFPRYSLIIKPLFYQRGTSRYEKDFLDGARGGVEAFEAGVGGVLDFEAGRGFAAAAVDAAGDDARNVGAVLHDVVEEGVEAADAAVLALDAAELHEGRA